MVRVSVLLMNIIGHLNALSVKLQGKDILLIDMHAHIGAFGIEVKM